MILGLAWWVWVLVVLGGSLAGMAIAAGLAALAGLLWGLWGLWVDRRRSRVS